MVSLWLMMSVLQQVKLQNIYVYVLGNVILGDKKRRIARAKLNRKFQKLLVEVVGWRADKYRKRLLGSFIKDHPLPWSSVNKLLWKISGTARENPVVSYGVAEEMYTKYACSRRDRTGNYRKGQWQTPKQVQTAKICRGFLIFKEEVEKTRKSKCVGIKGRITKELL